MTTETPSALAGCPATKKTIYRLTCYYVVLSLVLSFTFALLWHGLQVSLPAGRSPTLLNNVVATIEASKPFKAKILNRDRVKILENGAGEEVIRETIKVLVIPDCFAIVAVLIAGAFGGLIHGIRSFYAHVFEGDLEEAEIVKLVLRPFSGAILALIFYLVLRAGLGQPSMDSGQAGADQGASIMFYVAIGAIVGMFTDQTVAKLKKVAEAILTKPDSPEQRGGSKPKETEGKEPDKISEQGRTVDQTGKSDQEQHEKTDKGDEK